MESKFQRKHPLSGCPTFTEVAMAYFGRFEHRTAIKHFKECVDGNEQFSADLLTAGYTKWNAFFTPQQMVVVFKHLGPPDAICRDNQR